MSKTIIFDLDGTLTDSGEGIINCAIFALEHYGLPIPDRDTLRVFVGPPLRDSFYKFGVPADQLEEAVRVYRSRYIPIGKFENYPYEGIENVLSALKEQGHHLYVATSKPENMSIEILEHFGLAKYFDIIAGSAMDGVRDKKADVIAYLLEQIDDPGQPVMIGDTAFDVIGAAEHQIPTIGVTWGYGKKEDMVAAGAVAIAESMDQLLQLLSN